MRTSSLVVFAFGAALLGCGSSIPIGFDTDSGDTDGGDNTDGGDILFPDSSGDVAPPCENLKCQQVNCGNGATTTVSGTVWDPAGKNPLYNVVVYVPNAPVDAIPHGPICDSCGGANVSGKPIVTTLSDAKGHFVLKDVPVGSNIPLVIQAGKWRKQLTVPTVAQCTDTPVASANTRLPKNKTEGDMPLIALTAGCDPIHMLVQKIGIDPAELTDETGKGTVHVFTGFGGQNGGITTATDAYAFWGNKAKMMKYDIIINECECAPHPRDTIGPGYANMQAYLDAGGRVFNSHYHINFFGDTSAQTAAPDLYSSANWTLWSGSPSSAPYLVDTTFPKGKALADWMQNLATASLWGPSIKTSPYGQVTAFMVGDIASTKLGISQRWIYPQAGGSDGYISINTPTTAAPDKRCGRAVLTDLHVGSGGSAMTEQEAALEFMFFDLASCVIDDGTVPTPPPVN